MPIRTREEIARRLDANSNEADFIREAISEKLRRSADSNKHRFRELQVWGDREGDGDGNAVDRRLDMLIGKNGLVTDYSGGGGAISKELSDAMAAILTPTQHRRLIEHLSGEKTMEQIAHADGCAKQAVHTSIKAAKLRIKASPEVLRLLCERGAESSDGTGDGSIQRQVILAGSEKMTFDRMLELIAGDRPVLGDLVGKTGRLDPRVARAMKPILTRVQFKRFEMYLIDRLTMRQVAKREGCSVASAHRSIQLARRRLRCSVPVCRALCEVYSEATGVDIDADSIVAAMMERHVRLTKAA